jgi:penicillin amidase
MVFSDELGPELAADMLSNWYFWQHRLERMTKEGDSPWFDIVNTREKVETRDELFHQAALAVAEELGDEIGGSPEAWLWGKVHKIEFVNPLRRSGVGKSLVGGQVHAMGGSGETLYRGWYEFDMPAWVTHAASLRMVVDLGDPDKFLAVLSGGVTGRTFHRHLNDQLGTLMSGEKLYWWFSDAAIAAHTVHTLVLSPE